MAVIAWRKVLIAAFAGTAVAFALVMLDIAVTGQGATRLLRPGTTGPGSSLLMRDFPGAAHQTDDGLDGVWFYAIARQPMHLRAAARDLDRPRYRAQRILLPLLAWAVHPSGGGRGLIYSLFAVNLMFVFIGACATGALAASLRGPPATAALFPLLPGAFLSLDISVADAMAAAVVLLSVLAHLRGARRWAVLAAVAAVLTKETSIIPLVGLALAYRDRRSWILAATAGGAGILWAGFLLQLLPGTELRDELVAPFSGLFAAWQDRWSQGLELGGLVAVAGAFLVAAVALWRWRWRAPLGPVVAVTLLATFFYGPDVIGDTANAPRSTLPLLALAVVAAVSPGAAHGAVQGGHGLASRFDL